MKIAIATLLVCLLGVGCAGDDIRIPPDANPDAGAPPRCADVGCPGAALCNVNGCCSCNASGVPVQCLSADAEPNACEAP